MAKDRWAAWDGTRRMGFARFVLFYGVIAYGGLGIVLGGLDGTPPTGIHPVLRLIVRSVLGGLFWGILFWCFMEWLRNRARSKAQPPTSDPSPPPHP